MKKVIRNSHSLSIVKAPVSSKTKLRLGKYSFRRKVKRGGYFKLASQKDRNFIDTILGYGEASNVILASDLQAREKFANLLRDEFIWQRRRLRKAPYPTMYHVTLLSEEWQTGDEQPTIEIHKMQKVVRQHLMKEFGHFVGAGEIQAFANVRHPHGGKLLTFHAHVTCWADRIINISAVSERINKVLGAISDGTPSVKIDEIRNGDKSLSAVVRYGLKAPNRCKTLYISSTDPSRRNVNQSEAGDRYIRYMRLCDILSSIPLSRLVFAGGEGVFLRNRAMYLTKQWHAGRRKSRAVRDVNDVAAQWEVLRPIVLGDRFGKPVIR